MRALLPTPMASVGLEVLADLYAYPPGGCMRANMVSSLDGAVSADGKSKPISGPPDTYLFGVLRGLCDVVVVGAGTARAEGYGPGRVREEFAHLRTTAGQAAAPTIALVTRKAELDPAAEIFTKALNRTLVLTCESAPADRRASLNEVADVVLCGDDYVDLSVATSELHERGLVRVLTEGGPRLLGDLMSADLVDELALSLSPVVAGGNAGRILKTPDVVLHQMRLKSLLEEDGFLFALYARETMAL